MEKTSSIDLKLTDPQKIIKLRQALLTVPLLNPALQSDADVDKKDWVHIFPIAMGYSNSSYRIETQHKKYVLRIDTSAKNLFQCDRQHELAIITEAAKLQLAPEVVYSDIERGILITEYIEGRLLQKPDLSKPEIANNLNQLLDDISAIQVDISARLLHKTIGYYWQLLDPLLKEYPQLTSCRKQLQPLILDLSMRQHEYEICHNDLTAGNLILQQDDQIKALDWEYAALSHPLLDFAIFANAWELSNVQLSEMFPQKFYKMDFDWQQVRQLASFIEALWYAIRVTREPFGPWEKLLQQQIQQLSRY
ncbi:MAG TPA: hypothetical protein ENJ60_14485 [Aeromonadales bacterium]|nr:hypothetical protein [Aeromonadales bacterium]